MSTVTSSTQTAQDILSNLARTDTSADSVAADSRLQFLTLLTTQLKNQDPMNPMENAELTSQLAQLSTVEGIEKLNTLMGQLLDSQSSGESLQAASLVGRGVLVEGKGLQLTEAGAVGGFELDGPADSVVLSIKDSSGLEVASVTVTDVAAGSQNFIWDGTATDGSRAADGKYTVSVTATQGENNVVARTLEFGSVSSVIRGPSSTDLQVGSLGIFKVADIKQIL
ncbi:MAG: flagellar biosynthesis protein FlgD [Azoarcus sp.]|uniref:Basal-body rod modification protein FlgD n=1 Tax=Parazoarcus communis TaxID=41977 RepID=A0A2U8GLZ9_9RHOO|nr:flagellar hook assembly protein FlgD [Parazoarcus communis]AWI73976.1 flagellar biosynthesis protein FlgD [Parazoarcus communis]PLX67772.1 MAG: flagellar biosynthesis protein FlgD [Azoarcus sp.]TVT60977.1 MAG: flagellar hook assembly protein FlgD [Azoarcus sp. PHD]